MTDTPDRTLVENLRAGDQEALKEAYERFKSDVLALAATMLGPREGAWDVLHDVFMGLARRAKTLAPDSNLRGYLLTAAANRSRDVLAKRKEAQIDWETVPAIPCPRFAGPEELVASREQASRLWQAVMDLPDEQRIVIALKVYGGLSFKEISKQESISENTAQSRYRYALQKLRQRYKECA